MAMSDQDMPGFYLSAAHKSSGKTIVSIGLCAALHASGRHVQPFKKGPDYIDPLWLGQAAGTDCYNLDFNTQSREQVSSFFAQRSSGSDLVMVEGNKGLYDGVSIDGRDSNAALAKLLALPVILVLDARGITRGIAPLLLGYRQFDPDIDFRGVILNRVGGSRHEQKLRANIEAHTDFTVVGAVPEDERLRIRERHLGLTPSNEVERTGDMIGVIGEVIAASVDIDLLVEDKSGPVRADMVGVGAGAKPGHTAADVCIGVPKDAAFGFYYADDLQAFADNGARIVHFSTIEDDALPEELDGLFMGGGFPEVYLHELGNNLPMRRSILEFINADGPVYAECGGLMYLANSIRWHGGRTEMVGALPVDIVMQEKPVGRGYVKLRETGDSPWGRLAAADETIHAHEFHYSRVEITGELDHFAFEVERGWGLDGKRDGMVYKNVLAGYSHLRSAGAVDWVSGFVDFVRQCKI